MGVDGYRVGVDFGTSSTAAVLAGPDTRIRPLLFDGSPLLPSAVFASANGDLLTGRDAVHSARTHPERFEPAPKRCVDDGTVLLGDRAVPVVDLIAAVLRRIAAEAALVAGQPVRRAVLTHPASWGTVRRTALLAAAATAFPEPALVPEPVAAASYFLAEAGGRLVDGARAMVYDLGAGTFDATVVGRSGGGFQVLATGGLDDVGGLDVDAAIVASLAAVYGGRREAAWTRVVRPATTADRRASRIFWDDVRAGKEMLSRASTALLHVPVVDEEALLSREQLDQLARPILARTVEVVSRVLAAAGVRPDELAGLFLVGGASRMPLVATLLHQRLGVPPMLVDQPELVVASGSLHAPLPPQLDLPPPTPTPPPVASTAPPLATAPPQPAPAPPPAPAALTPTDSAPSAHDPAPTPAAPSTLGPATPPTPPPAAHAPPPAPTTPAPVGPATPPAPPPATHAPPPAPATAPAPPPPAAHAPAVEPATTGAAAGESAGRPASEPAVKAVEAVEAAGVPAALPGRAPTAEVPAVDDAGAATPSAAAASDSAASAEPAAPPGAAPPSAAPPGAGRTTAPPIPPPPARSAKHVRRLAVAAGLVVVLGLVGWVALRSDPPSGDTSDGATPTPTASSTPAPAAPSAAARPTPAVSELARNGQDGVHTLTLSPDGRWLAAIGRYTIQTYSLPDLRKVGKQLTVGKETNQVPGTSVVYKEDFEAAAISPDGKTVATYDSGMFGHVQVWDVASGRRLKRLSSTYWASCLAFSPRKDRLAVCAGHDESVRLWGVPGWGGLGKVNSDDPAAIRYVAFSPDGRLLATDGGKGRTLLWDASSRKRLAVLRTSEFPSGTAPISDPGVPVVFSPDGKILASGGVDGTVRLWDVGSRREVAVLGTHGDRVLDLSFAPDGTLVSSGADRRLRLWDIVRRQQVGATVSLPGVGAGGTDVAFSADSRTLYVSVEYRMQRWDVAAIKASTERTG